MKTLETNFESGKDHKDEKPKLSIKEKLGLGIFAGSALQTIPYLERTINEVLSYRDKAPIWDDLSYHAGDWIHIFGPYVVASAIEGNKKSWLSNSVLALTTAYHVLGEIFHSDIAPNLPQILPGTPDKWDVPIVLTTALGLALCGRTLLKKIGYQNKK